MGMADAVLLAAMMITPNVIAEAALPPLHLLSAVLTSSCKCTSQDG